MKQKQKTLWVVECPDAEWATVSGFPTRRLARKNVVFWERLLQGMGATAPRICVRAYVRRKR